MLITFVNNLDPDQAQQNVGPDLDPNCLILLVFLKEFFVIHKEVGCYYQTMPASVAQSDARSTGDQEVRGLISTGCCSILSWRLIVKYIIQ